MALTDSPLISVVIPCYNEGKILKDTLSRLKAAAEDFPGQTELIVVDDGSADNTAELAKQAGATVVSYGQNRGKGFALRAGAAASKGDVLLLTDADLAYGTDALREACLLLRSSGADLVCGSRRLSARAIPRCASWRRGGLPCFKRRCWGCP